MSYIEDLNYARDHRVAAGRRSDWFESFDERAMTAEVVYFDDETDDECRATIPVRMAVCDTCRGKGTHVNPSIDAGGISAEAFAEDPDFHEDYLAGVYDVKCYGCKGRRVVPVPDADRLGDEGRAIMARVDASMRALAESDRIQAEEMARGA
jgi:hypothetical protein